jgi:hypothetical protein
MKSIEELCAEEIVYPHLPTHIDQSEFSAENHKELFNSMFVLINLKQSTLDYKFSALVPQNNIQ